MKSIRTSHIVQGILISLIIILVDLIGQLTGLAYSAWYGWIGICLFIAGIILSSLYFGRQMNNQVTFGQLFARGFQTAAVIICLVFVYTWLCLYIFFPGIVEHKMQPGLIQARLQGKTEPEIKQYLAIGKKVFLAGNLMLNLVTGAAASILGCIITKKTVINAQTTK